ncbi:MAG TPA: hypothetical protein GX693_01200 [Firmicutes bacterium]|nr:hypothetical protein [Bacillota bacterium]
MGKGRILISVLAIVMAVALVSGATAALFTDTAANEDNAFKAGTVEVQAGEQEYCGVEIGNMAPGSVINGSFIVRNTGTLSLCFRVTPVTGGGLFEGENPAVVYITQNRTGKLKPGRSRTVWYTVSLPEGANSDYQEATGILSFTVDAVQSAHVNCADYWETFDPGDPGDPGEPGEPDPEGIVDFDFSYKNWDSKYNSGQNKTTVKFMVTTISGTEDGVPWEGPKSVKIWLDGYDEETVFQEYTISFNNGVAENLNQQVELIYDGEINPIKSNIRIQIDGVVKQPQ